MGWGVKIQIYEVQEFDSGTWCSLKIVENDSVRGSNHSVQSGLYWVFLIVRGHDRGYMALFGILRGVFWIFPL